MANVRINALTEDTALVSTDWLVAEVGDSEARKVSVATLRAAVGGYELAYVEGTSDVSITATTQAGANTVVSAGAVTFDGSTRVCIEFFSPSVSCGPAGEILVNLWQDSTDLGFMGYQAGGSAQVTAPNLLRRFLTPAAGSKTYVVKAWRNTANGTIHGGSTFLPMYVRITTA